MTLVVWDIGLENLAVRSGHAVRSKHGPIQATLDSRYAVRTQFRIDTYIRGPFLDSSGWENFELYSTLPMYSLLIVYSGLTYMWLIHKVEKSYHEVVASVPYGEYEFDILSMWMRLGLGMRFAAGGEYLHIELRNDLGYKSPYKHLAFPRLLPALML